jgi:hypothetical protein
MSFELLVTMVSTINSNKATIIRWQYLSKRIFNAKEIEPLKSNDSYINKYITFGFSSLKYFTTDYISNNLKSNCDLIPPINVASSYC